MNTDSILKGIDEQIAQLRQVRAALLGLGNSAGSGNTAQPAGKRRGRPKGTVNKMTEARVPAGKKTARRTMSAEGKAKIAAAQKRRWAAQKDAQEPVNASAKKPAKSKVAAPEPQQGSELAITDL